MSGLRFKNMAEFEAFKAKLKPKVRETLDEIAQAVPFGNSATATYGAMRVEAKPTTDESKLNKTERARLNHLRLLKVPCLNVQAITLKLANDTRLTPDLSYVDENGRLTFEDVKGWQREDAFIKMKVAARKFPEFRFVIVFKDKTGWRMEDVKP